MDMIDLIDMYRDKLDSDLYSCLLFALQLPSICSRVECKEHSDVYDDCWRNKKKHEVLDKASYKKWLTRHIFYLKPLFMPVMDSKTFAENVYNLRCLLTHEGVLLEQSDKDNNFYFVEGDSTFVLPNMVFLLPVLFCDAMFKCARSFLVNNGIRLDVGSYPGLLLPLPNYIDVMTTVQKTYIEWSTNTYEYTDDHDDGLLCILYDWLHVYCSKGADEDIETNELEKMDKFFKENPDKEYIMTGFSRRCAVIPNTNGLYIKDGPPLYGLSYGKTSELHLTKKDFSRMLYLHIRSVWFYKSTVKSIIDSHFKRLRDKEKHLTDDFDCDTL